MKNLLGTIPKTYLKTFEVIIQYSLSIRFSFFVIVTKILAVYFWESYVSEPVDLNMSSNDNENMGTGKTQTLSSLFTEHPHTSTIKYTAHTDNEKTLIE